MSAQTEGWKLAADRLWCAHALAYPEAALLVAEMARQSTEVRLQQASAQALPSLRAACLKDADRRSKDLARRRFGAVRDVLHGLSGPSFGKRRNDGGGDYCR